MITMDKVLDEISAKMLELDEVGIETRTVNKVKKRIAFLRTVARYLESDPSDDFLSKEIERLANRINLIHIEFAKYIPTKYFEKDKDRLKYYLDENDVPRLRLQLSALRFIANK
jgi:hypothetical protein